MISIKAELRSAFVFIAFCVSVSRLRNIGRNTWAGIKLSAGKMDARKIELHSCELVVRRPLLASPAPLFSNYLFDLPPPLPSPIHAIQDVIARTSSSPPPFSRKYPLEGGITLLLARADVSVLGRAARCVPMPIIARHEGRSRFYAGQDLELAPKLRLFRSYGTITGTRFEPARDLWRNPSSNLFNSNVLAVGNCRFIEGSIIIRCCLHAKKCNAVRRICANKCLSTARGWIL